MNRSTFSALILSFIIVMSAVAADLMPGKRKIRKEIKNELVNQENFRLTDFTHKSMRNLKLITAKADEPQAEIMLNEDFAKFSKGTEATPDETDIVDSKTGDIPSTYTALPGWYGGGVFQAGGTAYMGMVEGDYGFEPGFIGTPTLDLSAFEGTFTVTFKARSTATKDEVNLIWVDELEEGNYDGKSIEITKDWNTYTATFKGVGTTAMNIQMYSINVPVYFDDIVISQVEIEKIVLDVPVTKDATNVTEAGFTANWEPVNKAEAYAVYSILTHKAAADETYKLLDEGFDKIDFGTVEEPEEGNIQEYLDEYTNRCDWQVIKPVYASGMLGLDNSFAAMGLPGMLASPTLDLSHDGGKFAVDMTVLGAGITSIMIGHFSGGMEEPLETKDADIATGNQTLHFEFTEGTTDSYLIIMNGDGEGILFIDGISVSQNLKAGESTTLSYGYVETDQTSAVMLTPDKKANDDFKFKVAAFAMSPDGEEVYSSEFSEPKVVNYNTAINTVISGETRIYVDGCLNVDLTSPASVEVFTPSGVCVASVQAGAGNNKIDLSSGGIYMVKVGGHTFKVVK